MKEVRNDGNGPLLAYGYELAVGETVEMADEQAAQLDADPHVNVTVSSKKKSSSSSATAPHKEEE